MFQKNCRLVRAARCQLGGGGGGGSLGPGGFRIPSEEKKTFNNWFDNQFNNLTKLRSEDPFLKTAGNQSLMWFNNRLPQMLGQFPGFGKELQGFQGQLGDQAKQIGGWLNAPGGPASTIASGGALSAQMGRDVSQQYRNLNEAAGNVRGTGSLGQELLNRDQYRQQRYNTALGQGQGLLGQQQGIYGQQAGLVGQRASLLGQEQALQTGGLNQLLGVSNAGVSQYGSLSNPVLSYLGNLFGGNQNAAIQQAQISAQSGAAGDAKMGSAVGAGGSIIGALIPVVAAAV